MKKNNKERKNLLDLILDKIFNSLKNLTKRIIVSSFYLIIGIFAIIWYLLKSVNKILVKVFRKLPRHLQLGITYSLIGLAVIGIVSLSHTEVQVQTIVKTEIIEKVIAKENKETKVNKIDLQNKIANDIYNKAITKGLTQDQALIAVSISRHETGNWKSIAFESDNNFGGIMGSNGLIHYETYNEGLDEFVGVLKKYYFDLGLNTIEKIGAKYCPVGAKNDPTGVNKYWIGGVSSFYKEYKESVK